MNRRTRSLAAVLAAVSGLALGAASYGQLSNEFTYQGELRQSGAPATGAADFKFRLYRAETGGTQVGSEIPKSLPSMPNGRFTVGLDFGAFGPSTRWLEIEVKVGAGSFVILSPRQRITIAPVSGYASEAGTAANAANAANSAQLNGQGSGFYTNAGNMNAGTLPGGRLGGTYGNALTLNNTNNAITGVFTGGGAGLTGLNATNLATGTVPDARLSNNVAMRNVANAFTASGNTFAGFLGIGRNTPVTGADALAVRGTAGPAQYAGMYVEGSHAASWPFYGYATNGSAQAYHYLDGGTGTWHLQNGLSALSYTNTGALGIGTPTPDVPLDVVASSDRAFDVTNDAAAPGFGDGAFVSSAKPDSYALAVTNLAATGGDSRALTVETASPNGFAGHFTGGRNFFSGNVGIGTTLPETKLHVLRGNAGNVLANANSIAAFEHNDRGYLSILTPSAFERGILFGDQTSDVSGGIIYNSSNTPNAMQFRTGGNLVRMLIDNLGNVGIGTTTPFFPLHVTSAASLTAAINNPGGVGFGSGASIVSNADASWTLDLVNNGSGPGTETLRVTAQPFQRAVAVLGHFDMTGNFTCVGVKNFRIDHPTDPENKYLQHYCAESDQAINFYSGTATLDGTGGVSIDLPPYFAQVNKDPRYTLTAIGAPMPLLHIAEEISEAAIASGGHCSFRVAGGAPGAKVSWEVKAVRNDAWVRDHGMPVEVEKEAGEKGLYLYPAGFGQPQSRGTAQAAAARRAAAAAPPPAAPEARPSAPAAPASIEDPVARRVSSAKR